jgi:hypothetical protein
MAALGTPSSPFGCLVFGAVMLIASVAELVFFVFRPSCARRFRIHVCWGFGSSGPPVSRIGGAAWGLLFGAFGAAAILNGYLGVLSNYWTLRILLSSFVIVCLAGILDSWTYKRSRQTER